MKAIVQDRYGPPRDVLRLVDMGKPAVGDGGRRLATLSPPDPNLIGTSVQDLSSHAPIGNTLA